MKITKIIKSAANPAGMLIITPDKFDPAKMYAGAVVCHGIGEEGDGSSAQLDRVLGAIPKSVQLAADVDDFIIAMPQSPTNNYASVIDAARNYLVANFSLYSIGLTGLSMGGGNTWTFVASIPGNATKFDWIAPIASTYINNPDWSAIVKANLPVWAFHNRGDNNGGTPPAADINMVQAVKDAGGMAVYTGFNAQGHEGWTAAYSVDAPPVAPNGDGFINATVTVWKWGKLQTNTNRALPTGTAAPTSITASLKATLSGNTVTLDGSGSWGYKSARLAQTAWPATVKGTDLNIINGGTESGKVTLPAPGHYEFRLTVYKSTGYVGTIAAGTAADAVVSVDYAKPAPAKTPVSYDQIADTLLFDDGSSEQVTSAVTNLVSKQTVFKTVQGNTYTV